MTCDSVLAPSTFCYYYHSVSNSQALGISDFIYHVTQKVHHWVAFVTQLHWYGIYIVNFQLHIRLLSWIWFSAHVLSNSENKSILIKHESCMSVCLFVCSRFPTPPKVPASWNFGCRPNLGQLRSLRSPIFKILIFTDSRGLFRVFSNGVFRVFFFENLSHFNT